MLSNEWLIAIAVGLFVVGGLVGYLLRTFAFGGSRKEADLIAALEESEKALSDYKQEVLERFSDTADKFRRLNESYTDLHQQLAESAVALCGDEVTAPLLEVKPSVDNARSSEPETAPEEATVVNETETDEPLEGVEPALTQAPDELVPEPKPEPEPEESAANRSGTS